MSELTLPTSDHQVLRPVSWIILIGYLILALVTYVLISSFQFALNLFEQTEINIYINAVWFSFGIVLYGIYALNKNRKRAQLSNLKIKLDTQFLIIMAFLLFGLK